MDFIFCWYSYTLNKNDLATCLSLTSCAGIFKCINREHEELVNSGVDFRGWVLFGSLLNFVKWEHDICKFMAFWSMMDNDI